MYPSALALAARGGHDAIVRMLLEADTDMQAHDCVRSMANAMKEAIVSDHEVTFLILMEAWHGAVAMDNTSADVLKYLSDLLISSAEKKNNKTTVSALLVAGNKTIVHAAEGVGDPAHCSLIISTPHQSPLYRSCQPRH